MMFVVTQLNVVPHLRLWVLVDSETSLPLLFPLRFLIDRLSLRSASTQATALQSLKFFYDFWFKKYGVTFCFSFHQSGHNPLIAIEELESFYHYLESGNSNVPKLRIVNHHKPATHSCTNVRHVHAVIRFITYMINTYISPRYMDGSPKELSRLSSRLTNRVSMLRDEFQTGKIKNSHKQFRSLTAEMVRIFYEVIRPSSSSQINQLNPFPIGEIQFRNYLICRLLLNYGLRVSEVLLLEINSIKTNIRGDQFSIIVSSVEDDVKDPRRRNQDIGTAFCFRTKKTETGEPLMRGKELDTRIEHELQLMLVEGFDKSPISAKALHTRLKEKGILNGGLSTLRCLDLMMQGDF